MLTPSTSKTMTTRSMLPTTTAPEILNQFTGCFTHEFMEELWYLQKISRGDIPAAPKTDPWSTLFNVTMALLSLAPVPGLPLGLVLSKQLITKLQSFTGKGGEATSGAADTLLKAWNTTHEELKAQGAANFKGLAPEDKHDGLIDWEAARLAARLLGQRLAQRYEHVLRSRLEVSQPAKSIVPLARAIAGQVLAYLQAQPMVLAGQAADLHKRIEQLMNGAASGSVKEHLTWRDRIAAKTSGWAPRSASSPSSSPSDLTLSTLMAGGWPVSCFYQPVGIPDLQAYAQSLAVIAAQQSQTTAELSLNAFIARERKLDHPCQAVFHGDLHHALTSGVQVHMAFGNFAGSDFSGAVISGDLSGTCFDRANLIGAWFTSIHCDSAHPLRFAAAQLAFSSFEPKAPLAGADFTQADCSLSNFSGADLRGIKSTGTVWYKTQLTGVAQHTGQHLLAVQEEQFKTLQQQTRDALQAVNRRIDDREVELSKVSDRLRDLEAKLSEAHASGQDAVARETLQKQIDGLAALAAEQANVMAFKEYCKEALFTPAQAQAYLVQELKAEQLDGVDELAKRLGYLPIALGHAVVYLQQNRLTAREYLKEYDEVGVELLGDGQTSQQTVLTTWTLSMNQLRKQDEKAVLAVQLCAYLQPDDVPEALLQQALGLPTRAALRTVLHLVNTASLLTTAKEGVKIHRLVQDVIRYQDKRDEKAGGLARKARFEQRLEPLAKALVSLYPLTYHKTTDDIALARRLQGQLETITALLTPEYEGGRGVEHPAAAPLQASLWIALSDLNGLLANYSAAKSYAKRALSLRQSITEDASALAEAEIQLGDACYSLGEYPAAKSHCERAVQLLETTADSTKRPRGKAEAYINLGNAHGALGETRPALACYEKGLAIYLKVYGEAQPAVATSYSNLGNAHQALGDARQALACQEKALAIRLKVYGEAHPDVAASYGNLGATHEALGNARQALACQEKALAIRLKVYGKAHPAVATSYNDLGNTHETLGEARQALACQEKALAIRLKVYGGAHPAVATSYNDLGNAHEALGEAHQAVAYQKKALAIRLKVYGKAHPAVAASYNNLGTAHETLGEAHPALACQEKALAIRLKVYGEAHPAVAASYGNLGNAHDALGDARQALACQEKALAIFLKVYGETHPNVAVSYHNFGITHQTLGDARQALTCQEKALAIFLNVYGEAHPAVAHTYGNIGALYQDGLNNQDQARRYLEKALPIYRQFNQKQDVEGVLARLKKLTKKGLGAGLFTKKKQEFAQEDPASLKDPSCVIS